MAFDSVENDNLIWDKPGFLKKVKSDEDIILLAREDITILIFKAVRSYLLFFFLLIGKTLLDTFTDNRILLVSYDGFMYGVGAIIVVVFALQFHNYYLSIEIVTDERIIDIEQKSLFSREVNSMPVEKIQDATFKKEGFFSVIFDFGDVIIRSSGESNPNNKNGVDGFLFKNVPKPAEVAHLINEIYHKQKSTDYQEKIRQEMEYINKVSSQNKTQTENKPQPTNPNLTQNPAQNPVPNIAQNQQSNPNPSQTPNPNKNLSPQDRARMVAQNYNQSQLQKLAQNSNQNIAQNSNQNVSK